MNNLIKCTGTEKDHHDEIIFEQKNEFETKNPCPLCVAIDFISIYREELKKIKRCMKKILDTTIDC